MAHRKTLRIYDEKQPEQQLTLWINEHKRIFIMAGDLDRDDQIYQGFLSISKEDAQALIEELQNLVSQI